VNRDQGVACGLLVASALFMLGLIIWIASSVMTPRSAGAPTAAPYLPASSTLQRSWAPSPGDGSDVSVPRATSAVGEPEQAARTMVPVVLPVRSGVIAWAAAGLGSRYLALPIGPGHRVELRGPGGCIVVRSTDAGPALVLQRHGRIADLAVGLWATISGVPASRGLFRGIVARARRRRGGLRMRWVLLGLALMAWPFGRRPVIELCSHDHDRCSAMPGHFGGGSISATPDTGRPNASEASESGGAGSIAEGLDGDGEPPLAGGAR
jgi:hypothetical protein